VNKLYEIVGIDIVMHTMSDQIGDSDDFDRYSRSQQYQNDITKYKFKKIDVKDIKNFDQEHSLNNSHDKNKD
jgi:hypothetical protein